MPRVNVQEKTKEFEEKLKNGYFPTERSINTEVDYQRDKEPRDADAVLAFLKTNSFAYIKDME